MRAAAEGEIRSIKMITRKPPAGLEGAPYLRERNITLAGLTQPLKVFDGTAREGARGFPANVNVAAALRDVYKRQLAHLLGLSFAIALAGFFYRRKIFLRV